MTKKEKINIVDEVVFDNEAAAKMVVDENESKIAKASKGLVFGFGCSGCWLLYALLENWMAKSGSFGDLLSFIIFFAGLILMVLAYASSGIKTLIHVPVVAWKLGKIAHSIVPIFIIDLIAWYMTFVFALFGVFVVPWVYILIEKKQAETELEMAKDFLGKNVVA